MAMPTAGTPRNNPSHAMLHRVHHNVKAYGALGDGSTDDTAAFVLAFTAANEAVGGGYSAVFIPNGVYRVNGDTILSTLDGVEGLVIEGEGYLSSVIKYTGAPTCAFGIDGAVGCTIRNVAFQGAGAGGGVDGFRLYGNSRANLFENVRFNHAQNGFHALEDPGTPGADQNERNTFVNCHADNSTVGYRINSTNAQGQFFLGGGSSSCATAFYGSLGWAEFHSWFSAGSGAGTCWKTDNGWISTTLYSSLDENFATSFDLQNGTVIAHNTYFQGATNNFLITGQKFVDATNCNFTQGVFTAGANTVFNDRLNTFGGGVTFSVGVNALRYKYAQDGDYVYRNDWTAGNHTFFRSPEGYEDFNDMAAPAAPAAGLIRMYHSSADNKLHAKNSAGGDNAFW